MERSSLEPLWEFALTLTLYWLIAFVSVLLISSATIIVMYWRNPPSMSDIAAFAERVDLIKLTAIVIIVLTITLLALTKLIEGQAVASLLGLIAGYVLARHGEVEKSSSELNAQSNDNRSGEAS